MKKRTALIALVIYYTYIVLALGSVKQAYGTVLHVQSD